MQSPHPKQLSRHRGDQDRGCIDRKPIDHRAIQCKVEDIMRSLEELR